MLNKVMRDPKKWCLKLEIRCGYTLETNGLPEQRHSKLLLRNDKPFQVLEHINNNAYKLDLLGEMVLVQVLMFLFYLPLM